MALPPGPKGRPFIGNTFSFHSTAHELILQTEAQHPDSQIIRLSILGREVGLILDHKLATSILETGVTSPDSGERPRFSHRQAYSSLLSAFFEEPNILLEDEEEDGRANHRAQWEGMTQRAVEELFEGHEPVTGSSTSSYSEALDSIIQEHISEWTAQPVDLYSAMKKLSQEVVLHLFMGVSSKHPSYAEAERLSTVSLRGQFAAPLPLRFGGYYKTPYAKGLDAKRDFDKIVAAQLDTGTCPFAKAATGDGQHPIEMRSMATHTTMFSSGLIVKALASYLTFLMLQLHRPRGNEPPYADMVQQDERLLNLVLLETERLCPALIGVMRRVLDQPMQHGDQQVPVGWDVWLYFPLVNRYTGAFGANARAFDPERYRDGNTPRPLTFGSGGKSCIGQEIVRSIAQRVVRSIEDFEMKVEDGIEGLDASLRDFLGWSDTLSAGEVEAAKKWKGVKQLPVQRPKDPVMVRFIAR